MLFLKNAYVFALSVCLMRQAFRNLQVLQPGNVHDQIQYARGPVSAFTHGRTPFQK